MPAKSKSSAPKDSSSAKLGFEAKLWLSADKLRNNMDAAEYKHVVLGLIFLKYISDTFDEHHAKLVAGKGDFAGANPEDKDEYLAAMNLALRGIEADFGPENADTFRRDLHADLRADYVLANPPFNDSDWFRKDDDVRWQFGVPPKGNANFAWCSTSSTTSRRRAWPASSSPMAACPPTSPVTTMREAQVQCGPHTRRAWEANATSGKNPSRPTSWTAWTPSPASFFIARRSPCASGSR